MFLAGEGSTTPLEMGGSDYAFKKLKRWKAEGPTERNRNMARFLLNHGSISTPWSHVLPEQASLLIDLALEWSDFSIWQAVLERASDRQILQLDADILIRGWGVFTFDRTKHMLVHFTLALFPCSRFLPLAESGRLFAASLAQRPRSNL